MGRFKPGTGAAYRPALFTAGAFLVTWVCIFALESTYLFGYEMPGALVAFFDFTKSAAPLLVALVLLGGRLKEKGFLLGYLFGEPRGAASYGAAALLFLLQFLVFYLFRPAGAVLTVPLFLSTLLGQLLFGGGLEEGGWRGYLFPALRERLPVLLASAATSVVWTVWHLPYFIIPSSSQYGSSFLGYLLVTVMTGFLLSAVYMLTKSVLLCTLFHGFTNAVVMTMWADLGNLPLLLAYGALAAAGAVICQVLEARGR